MHIYGWVTNVQGVYMSTQLLHRNTIIYINKNNKEDTMKKSLEKHVVRLTPEERLYLLQLVSKEEASLKRKAHARILLKANAGEGGENCTDEEIRKSENISLETVKRIRRFYVTGGLEKLRLAAN
jgi:hypothetical protein